MSLSAEEFQEVINAEVDIDMVKLRNASRHGIPDLIRGDVWLYLLGVKTPDKIHELASSEAKRNEYISFAKENSDISKRIRNEAARYCKNRMKKIPGTSLANLISQKTSGTMASSSNSSTPTQNITQSSLATSSLKNIQKNPSTVLENVVTAFLNHNRHIDYDNSLIHLCGPFVFVLAEESDVYFCFERFMTMLSDGECVLVQLNLPKLHSSFSEEYFSSQSTNTRLSHFFMLFRTLLPDLYNHFEEEEVDFKEWSSSWLQYMLARELPIECVLRLWDTYFSTTEGGFHLHEFICLAILDNQKEDLEESEQSQIHSLVLRLPYLDMDQIISRAMDLRSQFVAQTY
ncbi:hypothetical protein HK096_007315, partial [Nowakowskiella sp. JEL0078]